MCEHEFGGTRGTKKAVEKSMTTEQTERNKRRVKRLDHMAKGRHEMANVRKEIGLVLL